MTRQRMVILDELRKVSSHPTADEVYEMVRKNLPRISLGTVYRNLEILSVMGLISKLEIDGFWRGSAEPKGAIPVISCLRRRPRLWLKSPTLMKQLKSERST